MGLKLAVAFILLIVACGPRQGSSDAFERVVRDEINKMREQFWAAARSGNADSMLAFHLDSAQVYRLYENGAAYDYAAQSEGHKTMKESITKIDFNVQVKDTMVFSREYAMETWDGTTVTSTKFGTKDTSTRFFVTLLYQHTPEGWKFRYIHSSSKPKM